MNVTVVKLRNLLKWIMPEKLKEKQNLDFSFELAIASEIL